VRRFIITPLVLCAAIMAGAEDFTLDLESLDLTTLDSRTEARLAQWNSPMGRVMYDVGQQQALILGGGQPGGAQGLAFRLKLQSGFSPFLMTATVETGIELYERSVVVVRWPWQETDEAELPLDEQLSLLLGRRLEMNSARDQESGAKE